MSYQDINAKTIDKWVDEGWKWGQPITHEEYIDAQNGKWDILLTPTKPVPHEWLGELKGKKVLGLASGGGQQMPILTALGGECTVFDYSNKQIESEILVANREGYDINTICGDMTKRLPFEDESFDIIVHPVSDCYVKDVKHVFMECYRVLKKGGILVCGFDNGINYIVDKSERHIVNSMPFDPLSNPDQMKQLTDQDCGIQFSHTIEELIGYQLQLGFILKDLYEDTNGEGYLHEMGIYSFFATKALK